MLNESVPLPASLNHVLDDVHTCYIFSPFYIIAQRFNAIFGLLDKDENGTLSSKSAVADVLYPPPLLYQLKSNITFRHPLCYNARGGGLRTCEAL